MIGLTLTLFFVGIIVLMLAVIFTAWDNRRQDRLGVIETAAGGFRHERVVINGNIAWIPLWISQPVTECTDEIMRALNAFGAAHPEFVLTSWQVVYRPASIVSSGITYGIWVNLYPRRQNDA